MAKRSKFMVDLQFLLGDTLIKTGIATLWLAALLAIYTRVGMPEMVERNAVGYYGMLAGMVTMAVGLWQLGRVMRREATIADGR
jgi:hypothetical protein